MQLISILAFGHPLLKSRQFVGLPPELTGGEDTRKKMDIPAFLTIEEEDGQIFLYRYSEDGILVGDTWHRDVNEAKDQASYEYRDAVGQWTDIPPDTEDAVSFGLEKIRLKDR